MPYGIGDFPGPLDANQQFYDEDVLTGNTASDVLDQGANFHPHPALPVGVALNVAALDTEDGDGAYHVKMQESHDNSNWSDTGLVFTITEAGNQHKIIGVTKRYLRLLPVITETTPSITLSAWLLPA